MTRNFKLTKGYTLIELLIFMGLMSVFLVVLTSVLTSILDARQESESSSSIQQDGSFLINRFFYDVPRAATVTVPASIGQNSSTLNLTINSANYSYSLNNGNLQLSINGGAPDLLNGINTTVSNLNFLRIGTNDGKETIQISFILTSNIQRVSGAETNNYQATIGLR